MAEPSEVSIESKINQVYIILNYFLLSINQAEYKKLLHIYIHIDLMLEVQMHMLIS